MSRQQRYDIDTVGFGSELGNFYDFYITNTFYLLAPDYYYQMYSTYFNRCLSVFDGWLQGWHDRENGLVPQRLLQSVARGLNNTILHMVLILVAKKTTACSQSSGLTK